MRFMLAVAQIDSIPGDMPANIRKHMAFVERARSGGADLVIFPELSLTGYSVKDASWDLAIRPSSTNVLKEFIAASNEIAILFGGIEESEDFGIYNAAFCADRGTVRTVHRKIYPPTYGMFEELRYFSPGKNVRAFDATCGRIGAIVCEDMWHLPLPYLLAKDGAELICGLSASPSRLSRSEGIDPAVRVNVEQHKVYARLLSSYVVFCNRVGFEDGVNFWGGSEIVGPNGEVAVQAKLFEEDLVFCEIDSMEVRRARRLSRHFLDDDPEFVRRELTRIARKDGPPAE